MAQRGKGHGEQLPQSCQPCALTCPAHFKAFSQQLVVPVVPLSLLFQSLFLCFVSVGACSLHQPHVSISGFAFTGGDAGRASGRFALLAAVQR